MGVVARACAAIVVVGAAATVVLGPASSAGAAGPPAHADALGVSLGPTRAKSVSFVVLLKATAQPTCLTSWASGAGLSVQWTPGQQWVSVSGTPRAVDRSFHVSINDYRSSTGKVTFAADHPPPCLLASAAK